MKISDMPDISTVPTTRLVQSGPDFESTITIVGNDGIPVVYNTPAKIPSVLNHVYSRAEILAGKLPVFFGPQQVGSSTYDYTPPKDWPQPGFLLRVPNVARFIWEKADLDAEAFVVGGFTGTFTYTVHQETFDVDDIFTGTGIFPSHVHARYDYPIGTHGLALYAVSFSDTYDGFLATTEGDFVLTGSATHCYIPAFISPPFSMVDYTTTNGITRNAIQNAYNFLAAGFIAPAVLTTADGDPPYTITPDGPESVGTRYYTTGIYYIDGKTLGDYTIHVPSDALIVPNGYAPPSITNALNRNTNLQSSLTPLQTLYKDSTYPYFDVMEKLQGYGVDDFLSPVTCTMPEYFATNCLSILYLAKPRLHIPSAVINMLKQQYLSSPHLKVVIAIDDQYMYDCSLPDTVITQFVNSIASLCNTLKDYGFTFGGTSKSGFSNGNTILNDFVIFCINSAFPRDHPPASVDPYRKSNNPNSNSTDPNSVGFSKISGVAGTSFTN